MRYGQSSLAHLALYVLFEYVLCFQHLEFGRARQVYCSGDSADLGGSQVTINGGIFRSNTAEELGGVLVAWGSTTVVTITGGSFSENRAK